MLAKNLLDLVGFCNELPDLVFVVRSYRFAESFHFFYISIHHLQHVVVVLGEDGDPHVGIGLGKAHGTGKAAAGQVEDVFLILLLIQHGEGQGEGVHQPELPVVQGLQDAP